MMWAFFSFQIKKKNRKAKGMQILTYRKGIHIPSKRDGERIHIPLST
jgi:hypothetical protein